MSVVCQCCISALDIQHFRRKAKGFFLGVEQTLMNSLQNDLLLIVWCTFFESNQKYNTKLQHFF